MGEKIPPALTSPHWSHDRLVEATALMRDIAANPPKTEAEVAERVRQVYALLPPSDEKPPAQP